ncbi:MAG: glycosyltransferase [Acidobacteriota bacterium]
MQREQVSKPGALLVTPIWPASSGNGLAMRAGLLLRALARDHRVDVWCIPVSGGSEALPAARQPSIDRHVVAGLEIDPGWLLATRVGPEALLRLGRPTACRFVTHTAVARLHGELDPLDYRYTLVFRSYLLPFVRPIEQSGGSLGFRLVDLDDDEATTHRRLAELDPTHAARHRLEAELYETLEATHLPWADHLLVAQDEHAERVRRRLPGLGVDVLPNAVAVPDRSTSWERPESTEVGATALRLLLAGNLTYLPNRAAARELALAIVPRLRSQGLNVRLRLIGRRPSPDVVELGTLDDVELLTDVDDLEPHYAWADQVVLPLRAGGGTRIKILEAFASGVPVVTTSMGADGLRVRDGEHMLIAETVDELVAASLRLTRSPDLCRSLSESAYDWVRRHHDQDGVSHRFADSLEVLA